MRPPGGPTPAPARGTPAITDTMGAAQMIVANPARNVRALYGLASASIPPFSPVLATAPDGWGDRAQLCPRGRVLTYPLSVALDGLGDVFVVNDSGRSASELTAQSGYGTSLNFVPSGACSLNGPVSIALDGAGDIFVANGKAGGSVSGFTRRAVTGRASTLPPRPRCSMIPFSIALDGSTTSSWRMKAT